MMIFGGKIAWDRCSGCIHTAGADKIEYRASWGLEMGSYGYVIPASGEKLSAENCLKTAIRADSQLFPGFFMKRLLDSGSIW